MDFLCVQFDFTIYRFFPNRSGCQDTTEKSALFSSANYALFKDKKPPLRVQKPFYHIADFSQLSKGAVLFCFSFAWESTPVQGEIKLLHFLFFPFAAPIFFVFFAVLGKLILFRSRLASKNAGNRKNNCYKGCPG